MSSNNYQNPGCTFAEPLISYLYDEINEAEKVEFEAHLESCADCHNELVQFGFARSAVQEWRGVEFENLATPVFDFPKNEIESLTAEHPQPWFVGLSAFFSFKPMLATAAFAVTVGLLGIAAFMFNFKSVGEISGKSGDQNVIQPDFSPTVERAAEQQRKTNVGIDEDKTIAPTNIVDKKQERLKTTPTKTGLTSPKKNRTEVVTVRTVGRTSTDNPKSNALPKTKVLRLSDEEDVEDNSVRLSDLFDEIETR